eukprot:scaffold10068_cov53-Amphora_coffeaeformis.AAC.1
MEIVRDRYTTTTTRKNDPKTIQHQANEKMAKITAYLQRSLRHLYFKPSNNIGDDETTPSSPVQDDGK